MDFESPEMQGACAAALRMDAKILRERALTHDDSFHGEVARFVANDLADRLDLEADLLGKSWCILCGAWDAVPNPHAAHPEPCGLCGAPTTPKVELKGILEALDVIEE